MDGQRFDELTRALAATTSRRGVLRALAVGAASVLAVRLDPRRADARPRRKPARPPACTGQGSCPRDMTCVNRRCACERALDTYCGPDVGCVDLERAREHCGICGNACGPTEVCRDAVCRCPDGDPPCNGVCCAERGGTSERCCDGACVNMLNNPRSCGACGNDCGDGECCYDRCCGAGETCLASPGEDPAFRHCCADELICGRRCGCLIGQHCVSTTESPFCCPDGSSTICNGVCCPANSECVDGSCQLGCPGGVAPLNIRGVECCQTVSGNTYQCGPFTCAFALSGTGPGGCDGWCDFPEEGALCGPGVPGIPTGENNGRACCCTVAGTETCIWP